MKNRKFLRIITGILCAAALCCVSFLLGGAAQDAHDKQTVHTKINWTMDGAFITADGVVQEQVTLTVNGAIFNSNTNGTEIDLEIAVPDTCHYKYISTDGRIRPYGSLNLPYHVWSGFCYDTAKNDSAFFYSAISIEQQAIIYCWDHMDGVYLVASANPDMTVQEMLTHFQGFISLIGRDE